MTIGLHLQSSPLLQAVNSTTDAIPKTLHKLITKDETYAKPYIDLYFRHCIYLNPGWKLEEWNEERVRTEITAYDGDLFDRIE